LDPAAFRAEFPVLRRLAYLNAGTDGPIPDRSARAAIARIEAETDAGRCGPLHGADLAALTERLRAAYAGLIGASADEVALTRSTTDGVNLVLSGLDLEPGDEVVTTDEEHPGLLGPVAALRRRTGAEIRVAPFAQSHEAVGPRTRLVATSHVSWMTGAIAPVDQLQDTGVPLLLDGAQSAGAIPIDVASLGCDFYAASGQKWLCGPNGTGFLFVRRERIDGLGMPRPGYVTLAENGDPLELQPRPGARRFDTGEPCGPAFAGALAALELFADAGWDWVFEQAANRAASLRESLFSRGEVVPGESTLVSWVSPADPGEAVRRLYEAGVVVRSIPGRPWLRASVGAWTADSDLDRLLATL
jgi:L-cysteine/cystine lyase